MAHGVGERSWTMNGSHFNLKYSKETDAGWLQVEGSLFPVRSLALFPARLLLDQNEKERIESEWKEIVREANRNYTHEMDEDTLLNFIADEAQGSWNWDGYYPQVYTVQRVPRGGGYNESDPYVFITFDDVKRTKFKVTVEKVK